MVRILERTQRLAIDLLFPPRCAICLAGGALVCHACVGALIPADGVRCDRCWTPIADGSTTCSHCRADHGIAFTSIRAPFVMEAEARELVHKLKYEGLTSLGEPMGALIAGHVDIDGDLVVPVPLHRGRQRSRGYNQSALLARQIGVTTGLPVDVRAIRRIRATQPLARTMHRDERRAIVAGAFAADRARVEGRSILLVDDVVTTGATLCACSTALLDAGAASARCVTFARAG
jgi:ComF family protein